MRVSSFFSKHLSQINLVCENVVSWTKNGKSLKSCNFGKVESRGGRGQSPIG